MAIYSIRDLEKLTGIKAHTIRIWEVRYGFIKPARTESNVRFYTDSELKRLFNIALLNRNGYKISQIARFSKFEIDEKVAGIAENNVENESQLDALTLSMIDLDEAKFDRIIRQNMAERGFEQTMFEVIFPFLDKLKLLWLTGSFSPAHENFVGHLLRQKIMVEIDRLPLAGKAHSRTWLLFLPDGETEELSLLFMNFLLKTRKNQVIYLGQHTSSTNLREICSSLKPDHAFTFVNVPMPRQPLQAWLDFIKKEIPHTHFVVTGVQFFSQPVELPGNCTLLRNLAETVRFLDSQPVRTGSKN